MSTLGDAIRRVSNAYEVRESIADLADAVSALIIDAGDNNPEIVLSRGGYKSLWERLDNIGGPKGAYTTLSDLQTAHPNGDTGLYLVVADGYIYKWNGTSWSSTGWQYQPVGIANGSIDISKLNSNSLNALSPINSKLNYNRDYNKLNIIKGFNTGGYIPYDKFNSANVTNFIDNTDIDFLSISKYLRLNYAVNTPILIVPSSSFYYANGDFPLVSGAWFRKSDLQALNDRSFLVKMRYSTDGTNWQINDITFATISSVNITTNGYSTTFTSGGTTLEVKVTGEFNGWVYIQTKVLSVDSTWLKYQPIFGVSMGTSANKIDVANWTIVKTLQDLIQYYVYPETTNDIELNTKDLLYKINMTDKLNFNIESQKINLLAGFNDGTANVYNGDTATTFSNFVNNTDANFLPVGKYLSIPVLANINLKASTSMIAYTAGDSPIVSGAWFRKSDLQSLSDRTFKMYIKYTTVADPTNYQELFFTAIPITNLLNVGYTNTQTVNGVSVKLDAITEFNGWIYIQRKILNIDSSWGQYKPEFGLIGNSAGKLDMVNWTVIKTIADLMPYFIYPDGSNNTPITTTSLNTINLTNSLNFNVESQKINLLAGFNDGTGKVYNDRNGALFTGFVDNTDATFIQATKYLSIPIVANDYIQVTSVSFNYAAGDIPIAVGAWFRKSDLQNLSDRTFKSYIKYSPISNPSSYQTIAFTEIPITNLLKAGYTNTQTVSGISVKLDVVTEFNGWIYIQRKILNINSSWAKYKPMFGIMTGASSGKIDFMNSVIIKTTSGLMPYFIYPDGGAVETKYSPSYLSIRVSNAEYFANEKGMFGDDNFDNGQIFKDFVQYVHDMGGGIIRLGRGIFRYTLEPKWKSKVSLVGAGMGKTVLRPVKTGGNGISAIGFNEGGSDSSYNNPYTNCIFADFEIDGSLVAPDSYTWYPKGIYMQFLRDCLFKNIYMHDTGATGLGIDYLDRTKIDNIITNNCGRLWTPGGPGGAGIGIGAGGMEFESFDVMDCKNYNSGAFGLFIEQHGNARTPGYPNSKEKVHIFNVHNNDGRNTGMNIQIPNVEISQCYSLRNAKHGYSLMGDYEGTTYGGGNLSELSMHDNKAELNGKSGLYINGVAGDFNTSKIKFNKFNQNSEHGIEYVVKNDSSIHTKEIDLGDNQCHDNIKKGVYVHCDSPTGVINTLDLSRIKAYRNGEESIFINASVNNLKLNGATIKNNANGVRFGAVNIKRLTILNNDIFDDQDTKTQVNSIVQDAGGTITTGRIKGNDCRDNISNAPVLNGTNTNLILADNDV